MDIKNAGINIPASIMIDRVDSSQKTLKEIVETTDWEEVILKPTIGGCARETFRFLRADVDKIEEDFKRLIQKEDMMIQLFQNSILSKGELSLIVINGKFSHAILKKAKEGDFRVQDDHGGSVHNYKPS